MDLLLYDMMLIINLVLQELRSNNIMHEPAVVVISVGTNDVNNPNCTIASTRRDVCELIDSARKKYTKSKVRTLSTVVKFKKKNHYNIVC